jgi:hypothetical protein
VKQVCDVVDCCKCLCSTLCVTLQACYGPGANTSSRPDLIYGMTARDALMNMMDVMLTVDDPLNR